jgi:hypothetical protein
MVAQRRFIALHFLTKKFTHFYGCTDINKHHPKKQKIENANPQRKRHGNKEAANKPILRFHRHFLQKIANQIHQNIPVTLARLARASKIAGNYPRRAKKSNQKKTLVSKIA